MKQNWVNDFAAISSDFNNFQNICKGFLTTCPIFRNINENCSSRLRKFQIKTTRFHIYLKCTQILVFFHEFNKNIKSLYNYKHYGQCGFWNELHFDEHHRKHLLMARDWHTIIFIRPGRPSPMGLEQILHFT